MKVPFLSLGASINELRPAIDAAHARVLDRGWVLLGPELEGFEKEWAAWLGVRQAVGVANGLDAIRLILQALGVGAGDEVIVPSNTYIATWLAASELGARPVPVEPDERTCNLDPARIEAAITVKTRAILVVHLYGQPADMDPILALARRRGLPVVEDAAQAHGARYHGRRIAGHGHAVAWSFYPTKNLGALADAGAITTDDDALADRLRVLRNYGQRKRYVCEAQGWNSRMDEMSAAVLREKLVHLEAWNARRSALAERYQRELAGIGLQLPWVAHGNDPVWHLFVVRHPLRDRIQAELERHGVGTICHYPIPPHLQAAYAGLGIAEGSLPIAERIHRTCFSLPLHPHLSDADQSHVIESLQRVLSEVNVHPGR